MKLVSKVAQNSSTVVAILNTTHQAGCVFLTSFRPRVASDKPFNYHSGLWLFLSHIILSQTCSKLRNDSIEDFRLEKIHFADLVKDAKSVAGFFPSRQFRVGGNDVT